MTFISTDILNLLAETLGEVSADGAARILPNLPVLKVAFWSEQEVLNTKLAWLDKACLV